MVLGWRTSRAACFAGGALLAYTVALPCGASQVPERRECSIAEYGAKPTAPRESKSSSTSLANDAKKNLGLALRKPLGTQRRRLFQKRAAGRIVERLDIRGRHGRQWRRDLHFIFSGQSAESSRNISAASPSDGSAATRRRCTFPDSFLIARRWFRLVSWWHDRCGMLDKGNDRAGIFAREACHVV